MGIQDKMETDQIWIKNNPANPIQNPMNFGQHYMRAQDTNYKEQLEMSYRTLGRTFNWDLEKYRMGPKPADKGNRRRFLKNSARFIKNPISYIYWKIRPYSKNYQSVPVVIIGSVFLTAVTLVMRTRRLREEKQFLQHLGQQEKPTTELTLDSEFKGLPVSDIYHNFFWGHISDSDIVPNPVYKQNYRKYFDRIHREQNQF